MKMVRSSHFIIRILCLHCCLGEALYRFLLSQTPQPPVYLLSLKGTHQETRTRLVSGRDNNGNVRTTTETYTETIIDFDFKIDIGRNVVAQPVQWSIPDSEPAYRGRSFKQTDLGLDGRRKRASRAERKQSKAWKAESRENGYAPWIGSINRYSNREQILGINPEASSKTLRQWADEYCASKMKLKEFTFRKVSLFRIYYFLSICLRSFRSYMDGISTLSNPQSAPRYTQQAITAGYMSSLNPAQTAS